MIMVDQFELRYLSYSVSATMRRLKDTQRKLMVL